MSSNDAAPHVLASESAAGGGATQWQPPSRTGSVIPVVAAPAVVSVEQSIKVEKRIKKDLKAGGEDRRIVKEALLRGVEWAEGELEELTNRVFNVLSKSNKAVNACHRDTIGDAFAKLFGVTRVSALEGSQPFLQPTVEPSSRQRKDKVSALIKNAKSWMAAALYAGFGVMEAKKRKDDRLKKRSADAVTAFGATITTAGSASGSRAADAAPPGSVIGDAEVPHAQAGGQSDPTGPLTQLTGQDPPAAPAVMPAPVSPPPPVAAGPEWSWAGVLQHRAEGGGRTSICNVDIKAAGFALPEPMEVSVVGFKRQLVPLDENGPHFTMEFTWVDQVDVRQAGKNFQDLITGHTDRHARIAIGSGAGAREFLMECPYATQAATSAYKVVCRLPLHQPQPQPQLTNAPPARATVVPSSQGASAIGNAAVRPAPAATPPPPSSRPAEALSRPAVVPSAPMGTHTNQAPPPAEPVHPSSATHVRADVGQAEIPPSAMSTGPHQRAAPTGLRDWAQREPVGIAITSPLRPVKRERSPEVATTGPEEPVGRTQKRERIGTTTSAAGAAPGAEVPPPQPASGTDPGNGRALPCVEVEDLAPPESSVSQLFLEADRRAIGNRLRTNLLAQPQVCQFLAEGIPHHQNLLTVTVAGKRLRLAVSLTPETDGNDMAQAPGAPAAEAPGANNDLGALLNTAVQEQRRTLRDVWSETDIFSTKKAYLDKVRDAVVDVPKECLLGEGDVTCSREGCGRRLAVPCPQGRKLVQQHPDSISHPHLAMFGPGAHRVVRCCEKCVVPEAEDKGVTWAQVKSVRVVPGLCPHPKETKMQQGSYTCPDCRETVAQGRTIALTVQRLVEHECHQ